MGRDTAKKQSKTLSVVISTMWVSAVDGLAFPGQFGHRLETFFINWTSGNKVSSSILVCPGMSQVAQW